MHIKKVISNPSKVDIEIIKVNNRIELGLAYDVRREVYIGEQKIREEDEFDEFDKESTHFLAYYKGKPVGTARWRHVKEGNKLERFAVVKEVRGKGIGAALVHAVVKDIEKNSSEGYMFLNAQTNVEGLYQKFGFHRTGNTFYECNIMHIKMIRK